MPPITAGTFMMGASERDTAADEHERPRHKVTLTRDFLMGKYPVTQALWESVMSSNPSKFKGANRPVDRVSWFDCILFCNKLSEIEGFEAVYTVNRRDVTCNWTAKGYRLPTEAEWEYAARAGQKSKYSGSNRVNDVAWFKGNSENRTHPVGQKHPNHFGLYDMSGNVWEWVWNWRDPYSSSPIVDPQGPTSGSIRVLRGGCFLNEAQCIRLSYYLGNNPRSSSYSLGFRLCRTQ